MLASAPMNRGPLVRALVCLAIAGTGTTARADDEPGAQPKLVPAKADPTASAPAEPPPNYSHKGQFGLSLRFGLGLRAIATYDNMVYCGATDTTTTTGFAPVCSGRAPFALELEASYGITRRIDAIVEMIFGLEQDFRASTTSMVSGPHPVKLAPGARFFYSEGARTKLFSTAQLAFDFTGYKDIMGAGRGNDVGVRNLNGLFYELSHDYSVYGYFGETMTFARWFDVEMELGVGVQGRFGH